MATLTQTVVPSTPQSLPDKVEQCLTLPGVSWVTYEQLLADLEDSHAAHFAYDQGTLEIMVLSFKHETLNRLLATIVEVVAEELDMDVVNAGSTTFKRQDLARGFEPDTSFYIQNVNQIQGKDEIDLLVDPAPDLVIEVDLSSSSLDKMPIYAAMAISEVWRYDGKELDVLVLTDGVYRKQAISVSLPKLTSPVIVQFIADGKTMKRTQWLRKLRAWIRAQA